MLSLLRLNTILSPSIFNIMKTSFYVLVTLLLCTGLNQIKAQNLNDLFPFAHYTLINTPNDALGYQVPIELWNTEYEGTDGISFSGLHAFDPGGSYARTVHMDALYDPEFAVQVEFKIEDLDGEFRSPIVLGQSYRYLGFVILADNTFAYLVNNNEMTPVTEVMPEEEVWYKVTIIYDTVSTNIQFWLDGIQLADFNQQVIRIPGDGEVANFHAGGGYPLKGNWRNLRIYGAQDISALKDELYAERNLKLYPNPASNELNFECALSQATHWRINAIRGEALKEGNMLEQHHHVFLEGLPSGDYYFQVLDENNKLLCRKQFVKIH